MQIIWKVTRAARRDTLHAYELPLAPKPGQKLISLCGNKEYAVASLYNDQDGDRCKTCERRLRKRSLSSGRPLGDVDGL